MLPTDLTSIQDRVKAIDPKAYARSRNFEDGKVTKLSPYISRGVVSTRQIMLYILDEYGFNSETEKLIQELAWRDYWQLIWQEKNINQDLKKTQERVDNQEIPEAIVEANCGIDAIDQKIKTLYETGYMHNHMRMYVAFMACNLGHSHWKTPAQWMYYHLLDGDWASNALSWQWVAGSNSNKKYIANQENINKYFYSNQRNSYLDTSYEQLSELQKPKELEQLIAPSLKTDLSKYENELVVDSSKPSLIYNYYNLDPYWHSEKEYNRILLLEPSKFEMYPVGEKALDFAIALSKNISELKIMVGEFEDLMNQLKIENVIYKEHPLNYNYKGIQEEREWMFELKGYFPSFFKFWNKAKKELKNYASNN